MPDHINVKIRINSTMKNLISKKDFNAYVEVGTVGESTYPVKLISPENIEVLDYYPKEVEVKFIKLKRHKK